MDSVQQQLQARLQKYIDREKNNDSYTRALESKMEGATTEEERKETLIVELKKEISRVRESESTAEDYISTLEERIAEVEQDQEIMQREIDRLEHVVERQRSVGRLDNLLGELDGMRNGESHAPTANGANGAESRGVIEAKPSTNGHHLDDDYDPFRPASESDSVYEDAENEAAERNEGEEAHQPESAAPQDHAVQPVLPPHTALQGDSKLEGLTPEFFEAVLKDYDNLQQKYRTALETLAKLEYDKDGTKATADAEAVPPQIFSAGAEVQDVRKSIGGEPSSELPSHETQETGAGAAEPVHKRSASEHSAVDTDLADRDSAKSPASVDHEDMAQEMETLRKLHAEKEVSVAELTTNYMSLAQKHEATLARVHLLKKEVQRTQSTRPDSPNFPSSPSFSRSNFRRKSDELLSSSSYRASKSFVSLKTIALNNFEDNTEVRHTFEQNLTTVMSELHTRSERLKTVEAELGTVKKEMESKQTIIAGLTRERSSLTAGTASGVDFSVVGQMRDQLMESENQIRSLHEQHAAKEQDFQDQIDELKASIDEHQKSQSVLSPAVTQDQEIPGYFPETPLERSPTVRQATGGAHRGDVARLKKEVADWETKHHETMNSMQSSQANLLSTIAELQESLRRAEQGNALRSPSMASLHDDDDIEEERIMHRSVVNLLQKEVHEHKTTANEHKSLAEDRGNTLEELQQKHVELLDRADKDSYAREIAERDLHTHKELVANLENQLQVHKSAVSIHQESLESLQSAHTKDIEQLNSDLDMLQKDYVAKNTKLQEKHEKEITDLQSELQKSQADVTSILRAASSALGFQTDGSKLHAQIKGLVEEGKELHGRHLKTTNELKAVQEELQTAMNRSVDMDNTVSELKMISEERGLNLNKMTDKFNKSSRLVDELEEQLNSNFDSHQATNKRLSTFQSETVQARMELERELEDHKMRNSQLEAQISTIKRQSITSDASALFNRQSLSPEAAAIALARSTSTSSNPRKSTGASILPTPPPSIPLPPLPSSPTSSQATTMNGFEALTPRATSPVGIGYSPPTSRHTSHDMQPHHSAQLLEEQESRIRTIEKHLFAEKQLTATLEEALVDLETSANRTKSELDNWRKRCAGLEDELVGLRKERGDSRASLQAVEEEREMRVRAERARTALEQRMAELNATKKKKKNTLNCF